MKEMNKRTINHCHNIKKYKQETKLNSWIFSIAHIETAQLNDITPGLQGDCEKLPS